jgi:hypothetical protein
MTDQTPIKFKDAGHLLRIALQELKEEHQRIDNLIRLNRPDNQPHPLRHHALTVYNKFTNQVERARTSLVNLELYLNTEQYQEAWEEYTRLRKNLMPPLANELLAVLGGLYLHQLHLEDIPGGEEKSSGLSFTDTARILVNEMADNSATEWASVLIVGEEQLSHSEAEVIRLRFPACDLWNLMLTAHEYGFLVAHKSRAKKFNDLLSDVKRFVEPQTHRIMGRPSYADCYLPEIIRFWKEYDSQMSEEEKGNFIQLRSRDITRMKNLQEAHLRRLFADAFATYVGGPGYVLALIYLRLLPDDQLHQPSEYMPAMDVRLFTCLQILSWMNTEPSFVIRMGGKKPFDMFVLDVSTNQSNIPDLWVQTMQTVEPQVSKEEIYALYISLREKYKDWLDIFKEDLQENFAKAIQCSYDNWQQARTLRDIFLGRSEAQVTSASILPVLNAAWVARHENDWKLATIQSEALRILKSRVKSVPGGAEPSSNLLDMFVGEVDEQKSKDIAMLKKLLEKEPRELKYLTNMIEADDFSGDHLLALKKYFAEVANDDGYDALMRLEAKSKARKKQ